MLRLLALTTVATLSALNSPSPHAAEPVTPLSVYLSCRGSGERTVVNHGGAITVSGTQIAGHNVGDNAGASVGSMTSRTNFNEQLDVSIVRGKAQVRLPQRFLPFFHRTRQGWVGVDNLIIRKDEVLGNLDVNLTEHPRIRIDRIAGSVAMDGKIGSFYGLCQSLDAEHPAF